MKKKYITPVTENVNVRLFNSVMDGSGFGRYSYVTGGGDDPLYGDAKENTIFETDGSFGDIWGDADDTGNPYDIWGE